MKEIKRNADGWIDYDYYSKHSVRICPDNHKLDCVNCTFCDDEQIDYYWYICNKHNVYISFETLKRQEMFEKTGCPYCFDTYMQGSAAGNQCVCGRYW